MITRAGMNARRASGDRSGQAASARTSCLGDVLAAGPPQQVLEQHADRVGQRQRIDDAVDPVERLPGAERVARGERIGIGHAPKPTSDPDTLGVWHHRDLACVCRLDITPPFEVFINGVRAAGGSRLRAWTDAALVFSQTLIPPRKDTARSLFRTLFFGRYKPEHVVDVAYQVNGRRQVESGLEIVD